MMSNTELDNKHHTNKQISTLTKKMKKILNKIKIFIIDLVYPYKQWKYGAKFTIKELEKVVTIELPKPYTMAVDNKGLHLGRRLLKTAECINVTRVNDPDEFEKFVVTLKNEGNVK